MSDINGLILGSGLWPCHMMFRINFNNNFYSQNRIHSPNCKLCSQCFQITIKQTVVFVWLLLVYTGITMIKRFIGPWWAIYQQFFIIWKLFNCSIINKHNIHNKVKKKITGGFCFQIMYICISSFLKIWKTKNVY